MQEERVKLTKDQAIAMLAPEGQIHTFRQAGPAILGADWDREDIIKAIEKHPPELSGKQATAMQHGMVLLDEHGYLFIETLANKALNSDAAKSRRAG